MSPLRAALVGLALSCLALSVSPADAQGLTCPKGETAVCTGKSTVCLDAMNCNSEGYTCRSGLTGCARDLAALQSRFDLLARDYQALKLQTDQAARDTELLRRQLQEADRNYRALQDCILFATSLEDVQFCP